MSFYRACKSVALFWAFASLPWATATVPDNAGSVAKVTESVADGLQPVLIANTEDVGYVGDITVHPSLYDRDADENIARHVSFNAKFACRYVRNFMHSRFADTFCLRMNRPQVSEQHIDDDLKKAEEYFKKASDLLSSDISVYDEVYELMEKAAALGDDRALHYLARAYMVC